MSHELPPLPYSHDALQPHISQETLEYHHDKHHAAYVKNLNNLIDGTEFADKDLETIVRTAPAGGVYNNAAQVWNHTFYFSGLGPNGGGEPGGDLAAAIDAAFDPALEVVGTRSLLPGRGTAFDDLAATAPTQAVDAAHDVDEVGSGGGRRECPW